MSGIAIRDLGVTLSARGEPPRRILQDIAIDILGGSAFGLVGESGSGKSTLARAILRDLPSGAVTGQIQFDERDIYQFNAAELRAYRSRDVTLIGQNPRASMNPVRRVGDFAVESLRLNAGVSKREAGAHLSALLTDVGIRNVDRVLGQYPHQLSGGMLQRVVIAAALATEPALIIADEPTTALDVTTQAEVMAILSEQTKKRGMALLLISHDLDLVAAVCDRTALMYAGQLVEEQTSQGLLATPRHPYAAALAAARTRADVDVERLAAIPGRPIAAYEAGTGCSFAPRCSYAQPGRCDVATPPLEAKGADRVACFRSDELTLSHNKPGSVSP